MKVAWGDVEIDGGGRVKMILCHEQTLANIDVWRTGACVRARS